MTNLSSNTCMYFFLKYDQEVWLFYNKTDVNWIKKIEIDIKIDKFSKRYTSNLKSVTLKTSCSFSWTTKALSQNTTPLHSFCCFKVISWQPKQRDRFSTFIGWGWEPWTGNGKWKLEISKLIYFDYMFGKYTRCLIMFVIVRNVAFLLYLKTGAHRNIL